MTKTEFKQGDQLCSEGDSLHTLLFITKGSAEASFNGRVFNFDQGDAIGLCDLSTGKHSHTYTATSDITAFTHPYDGPGSLEHLFDENANVAGLLIGSMSRQISEFLMYWATLKREADSSYALINDAYVKYEKLCKLYALSSKKLPGLPEIALASQSNLVPDWTFNYYMGIKSHDAAMQKSFFSSTGISLGFLLKSAEDFVSILHDCKAYQEYLQGISEFFISSEGYDLFALISELHFNSMNVKGADDTVTSLMSQLTGLMSNMTYLDRALFGERVKTYKETLVDKRANKKETSASSGGLKQNLSNSLEIIIEYSGMSEEDGNKFIRRVHDFRLLTDKGSSDDGAYRLRKELTENFYTLYKPVFLRTLDDPEVPTVIKMFLNFGYVDAALAGYENADYLYSIADSLKGDPSAGVYTICEWLHSIYEGKNEPSRNDFDEDFDAHVRELKIARRINEKEEKELLANLEAKLIFEIENVFPIVNKITFGRITTFCPLFSDYNVQRSLETSMLTPTIVKECLDDIISVDYSAFYRQTIYSNPEIGVPKEYIHMEIRPNIILTPVMGTRGAMWQEIEGRKRSTPARMFMPIFLLGDLRTMLITLTGEFRWEMCKRTQGPRWTELSDPSLTSEMFDYLQFYRNNRDLSTEAKSAIKTELVRAKNTYKTVFVSNYLDWLMYEANGSPRLNKIARRILLTYCTFALDVRGKLTQNPQYAELIRRYEIKVQQREQHLLRVYQKIEQLGQEVPQELVEEMEYAKR